MLPVRVIGGPGRRYRQREQERTREKRTVRSAGMPEKNAETCLGQHGTYLPAAAGKSMPMPPCRWDNETA